MMRQIGIRQSRTMGNSTPQEGLLTPHQQKLLNNQYNKNLNNQIDQAQYPEYTDQGRTDYQDSKPIIHITPVNGHQTSSSDFQYNSTTTNIADVIKS